MPYTTCHLSMSGNVPEVILQRIWLYTQQLRKKLLQEINATITYQMQK